MMYARAIRIRLIQANGWASNLSWRCFRVYWHFLYGRLYVWVHKESKLIILYKWGIYVKSTKRS